MFGGSKANPENYNNQDPFLPAIAVTDAHLNVEFAETLLYGIDSEPFYSVDTLTENVALGQIIGLSVPRTKNFYRMDNSNAYLLIRLIMDPTQGCQNLQVWRVHLNFDPTEIGF